MKKLTIVCLALLCATSSLAQPGIQFFKGSWKELLNQARQKNKLIFIDVYTDWCVPCKYMDKFVFTEKSVGSKYNTLFINYKLDAEKGDGPELTKRYGVGAYPTFLFLNSSGNLVHKVVGEKEIAAFINEATEANKHGLDSNNVGNLESRFKDGDRSQPFLRRYLEKLTNFNMDNSAILDEYFNTIPVEQLAADSTLLYLAQNINGTNSASLVHFIKYYDSLMDNLKAKLTDILFNKLVRNGAGLALKEKRLLEYERLIDFGNRLYGLNDNHRNLLNRFKLIYAGYVRNYDDLKQAGYTLATKPYSIPIDTIKAEDVRRYQKIMKPYLTGQADSTKVPGFAEERKMVVNIYSREIAEKLYTAVQAFTQLPSTEKQALQDALAWMKRCEELMPGTPAFVDIKERVSAKLK